MHKSDYLAQVEALRASPELRARVAGLAGTPARRRRLRPWMGVCACLAVLPLGGTLLLPRLGAAPPCGGGARRGASSSPTPDRSFP
ncbi:MAG: hypothetical protein ACLRWQ_01845 [Flavonifractor plautii]